MVAGAGSGRVSACCGNAPPADLHGGRRSAGLGGALAGLAIVSRTELLLPILGGLFVIVTLSVMIQVSVFKVTRIRTGRRCACSV